MVAIVRHRLAVIVVDRVHVRVPLAAIIADHALLVHAHRRAIVRVHHHAIVTVTATVHDHPTSVDIIDVVDHDHRDLMIVTMTDDEIIDRDHVVRDGTITDAHRQEDEAGVEVMKDDKQHTTRTILVLNHSQKQIEHIIH